MHAKKAFRDSDRGGGLIVHRVPAEEGVSHSGAGCAAPPFRYTCLEKISVALVPPKPKELERTLTTSTFLALFGT